MAEGGALPKGFERPSGSSPQSSSQPRKGGTDKVGISLAIGITVIAVIIGVGFTGIVPIDEELSSLLPKGTAPTAPVVQQTPSAPVVQQAPPTYTPTTSMPSPLVGGSYGSYATSDGNMIDQLDWSISDGDVKGMYLDKDSSGLTIHTITRDGGELFVGLNADYIGSDDGTFFIIVDNQEHEDYEQAGMDLYIDLPAGAETVEIICSYIIS